MPSTTPHSSQGFSATEHTVSKAQTNLSCRYGVLTGDMEQVSQLVSKIPRPSTEPQGSLTF